MTKTEVRFILLGIAIITLVSGCTARRVYVREPVYTPSTAVYTSPDAQPQIVYVEPPSPRREVIGTPPSSSHVWVDGYWTHHDGKWQWTSGHWETKPRPGASYTPGRWEKSSAGRGWIWVPGHWE